MLVGVGKRDACQVEVVVIVVAVVVLALLLFICVLVSLFSRIHVERRA